MFQLRYMNMLYQKIMVSTWLIWHLLLFFSLKWPDMGLKWTFICSKFSLYPSMYFWCEIFDYRSSIVRSSEWLLSFSCSGSDENLNQWVPKFCFSLPWYRVILYCKIQKLNFCYFLPPNIDVFQNPLLKNGWVPRNPR